MDTDNHFGFAGIPPAPTASGLKPTAPSSGDNPYSNGAALSFPPQGKSLNGGMNVNGFSTVSHTTTSGTFTSSTHSSGPPPHLHHPYDCLWDYTQFQPPGGLKDGSLAQFPLNGVSGGSRPPSPGHGANLRAAGTELWGNGTSGSMGLNFDSQELYDSFPEQSFELLPNGPTSFYAAPQPSPLLGSGEPPFPLPEEDLGGDADDAEASKELQPSSMAENGAGLVGSMELEDAQPDLKLCAYNGAAPTAVPLSRQSPGLTPPTAASLGSASPMGAPLEDAQLLSGDPLEPFEALARDPDTDDLYAMDETQLVGDKSPLEEPPDDAPGPQSSLPSPSGSTGGYGTWIWFSLPCCTA